ncbi:fibroblast growth factor receptor homolog 1-like isoform X2 [Homalodisca vitripennis]|uniref:fibroblast growth factor receptor homolog 1-like isoform X2 n=1 Tax=Homalodisca vitripennis TaxID=197043 RepID=UPI001EECB228|nr:fibroblast growth factor receptor homolog 1-like isoform X2 [Homalodisca vitripennis]
MGRGSISILLLISLSLSSVSSRPPSDLQLHESHTDYVVEAGRRLVVDCGETVAGQSGPVSWLKDGTPLKPNSRISFTLNKQRMKIRNVSQKDNGEYSCQVRGEKGDRYNMSLSVLELVSEVDRPSLPPILSSRRDPEDDGMNQLSLEQSEGEGRAPVFSNPSLMHNMVAALLGSNYTLTCASDGLPTPEVSWYKNGRQMPAASVNLTVLVSESANYTCIVSNSLDSLTHTTQLQAYRDKSSMPIIVETPSNTTVRPGSTTWLICKVSSLEDSKIEWLRHDNFPPHRFNRSDPELQYINKADRYDPQRLVLENLHMSDNGWYTCMVTTPRGTDYSSVWLQVAQAGEESVSPSLALVDTDTEDLDTGDKQWTAGAHNTTGIDTAPHFTRLDKMHRIVVKPAGNMMRLKCPAEGNPIPNITWYKDGKTPERNLGNIRYGPRSMVLEDLVVSDSGNYTCVVCNILGCINFTFSAEIHERFPHKPYIKDGFPRNVTALVNSSVRFECSTISDLEPYVQWMRVSFKPGDDDKMPNGTEIFEQQSEDAEVLNLYNVTHEDEGWYTCIASNNLGNTVASAYLSVVDELVEPPVLVVQTAQPMVVIILAGVLCTMFLLGICIMMNVFRRLKREKLKKILAIETARAAVVTQWTKKVIVEKQTLANDQDASLLLPVVKIEKQKSRSNKMDSAVSEYELPLDCDWEFPRDQLTLGKTLGEGAFGKVIRAEAQGILQQGIATVAAVKMLKEGHTDTEMMDLVSEMEMMKMIGKHRNIINLLGCCTQDGPLFVIVEFAPHGNLRDFLRQHRPSSGYEPAIGSNVKDRNTLTQKDLVSFAFQVARGMEYLASRRCIHRDLAARNVLVSDNYILKIADFGLARDIHSHDYYRKTTDGRLPVKWMAPEALFHRVYTTQSDVWSYGVLLWEIMTLGGTPYPSVPSMEKLFQLLRSGHRMEKPPCCSLEIYMLMRDCWSYQPNERPMFSELVEDLDRILTITANEEYLDLGLPQLDTPPSSEESSVGEEQFPYLL